MLLILILVVILIIYYMYSSYSELYKHIISFNFLFCKNILLTFLVSFIPPVLHVKWLLPLMCAFKQNLNNLNFMYIAYSFVICFGIMQLCSWLTGIFLSFILPYLNNLIKSKLFSQIHTYNHSFFLNHKEGYIDRQIHILAENTCNIIELFIKDIVPNILPIILIIFDTQKLSNLSFDFIINIPGYATICFVQNVATFLQIFIILWIIIFSISMYYTNKKLYEVGASLIKTRAEQSGFITDTIRNIFITKIFNAESWIFKKYHTIQNGELLSYYNTLQYQWYQRFLLASINSLFFVLMIFITYYLASINVKSNICVLLVDQAWLIVLSIWRIVGNILPLINLIGQIKKSLQLLDSNNIITPTTKLIKYFEQKIECHFSYTAENGIIVFEDTNLTIHVKDKIFLIGPSGSGKTTFTLLLIGLLHCTTILVDNIDLRDINNSQWLQNFIYIGATPLYNLSIKDNICLDMNVSDEMFHMILDLCKLDELVNLLPDGYNTHVGVGGGFLSMGQQKRVVIARGLLRYFMLKDHVTNLIIILDELLTNLDIETQLYFIEKITHLFKDQTVITIEHNHVMQNLLPKYWDNIKTYIIYNKRIIENI